ncbi:MAG TPA: rRNA maturation RNase YbeY [Bryobacteraceae bacterium]|nr:rRNA maturation RNase YbeY [Bryobacteraceae bacterium]
MEPHSTVLFQRAPRGLSRRAVKAFALRLENEVAGGRRFTCMITGDAELERLNRQFLGHDYATDVLSFPSPGPDGFLGEIAISADRAAEQAARYGHTLDAEIGILLLHGVLHLTGMDHERDRGRMARAERRYRAELGLPAGLIERVRV